MREISNFVKRSSGCLKAFSLAWARFSEAAIKQLLYCTQISESYYRRSALGELLSVNCEECKTASQPRHKISTGDERNNIYWELAIHYLDELKKAASDYSKLNCKQRAKYLKKRKLIH